MTPGPPPAAERHEAIVIGAGPAGLAAAALLRRRGFETLVLERSGQVGARWAARYDGLRLNSMRIFSTLPGYRIPRRDGRFPSRDAFVSYLGDYASHHGLDVRLETELDRVDRPEADGWWRLGTSRGPLLARYAVVATGFDAIPVRPDWAESGGFTGELLHSSELRALQPYRGREVLVVGAGNSGLDIAGHLVDIGATVSVAMRTPPNLFPRQWHGIPLQPLGLPAERLPPKVGDVAGRGIQHLIYGDLSPHGIPRAPEGIQSTFRHRLVSPAIDAGFVAALKGGRTRIVKPVAGLDGSDVVLVDGTRLQPDAVICATGYRRGLEGLVGHLGVLRPDGVPVHFHGAPEHPAAPRLYFAGFDGAPTGQIRLMPGHARRIARSVGRDRQRASSPSTQPAGI